MALKIQILEDEPLQVIKLNKFCIENGYNVVCTSDNVSEALRHLLIFKPEIALVDINLKGERSGIDFGLKLRETSDTKIIFTSSLMDEQTLEKASKVNPDAYLVKPIDKDSLKAAIELARNQFSTPELNETFDTASTENKGLDSLFIKVGSVFKRINFENIDVVSSGTKNHSDVVLDAGQCVSLRKPLTQLEEVLPSFFWRIHRKHIVNSTKITYVDSALESLQIGENHYPIGRSFQKVVAKNFRYLT